MKQRFLNRHISFEIICAFLIIYFFYEGIQKIAYWGQYQFWLSHTPLIKNAGNILVWLIPILELSIVFLLIVPKWQRIVFLIIIITQLAFVIWIAYVYLFTGYLFWPYHALWEEPTWMQKISIALALSWLAFAGLMIQENSKQPKIILRNNPADVN